MLNFHDHKKGRHANSELQNFSEGLRQCNKAKLTKQKTQIKIRRKSFYMLIISPTM